MVTLCVWDHQVSSSTPGWFRFRFFEPHSKNHSKGAKIPQIRSKYSESLKKPNGRKRLETIKINHIHTPASLCTILYCTMYRPMGQRRADNIIAFTTGLPDAGNALHRNFLPPKAAATGAEPMDQSETAAVVQSQQNSSAAPLIAPTQEVQATPSATNTAPQSTSQQPHNGEQEDETSGKRQRSDGSPQQAEHDDGLTDIVIALNEKLAIPDSSSQESLSKSVNAKQMKWLDVQRQIARLKEKINTGELPHGFKVFEADLGTLNAEEAENIRNLQLASGKEILEELLTAKQNDAMRLHAERAALLTDAIAQFSASLERRFAINPDRYRQVDTQWIIDTASETFAKISIVAEIDADEKYDKKAQIRAIKQLAFQEKQQAEQQAARDRANQPASMLDVERILEEKMKTRSRPNREARQSDNRTQKGQKNEKNEKNENHKKVKGKGKGGKGGKGAKSKGSKGGKGKRDKRRDITPTTPKTPSHSTYRVPLTDITNTVQHSTDAV